jgi:hypothetical protein
MCLDFCFFLARTDVYICVFVYFARYNDFLVVVAGEGCRVILAFVTSVLK